MKPLFRKISTYLTVGIMGFTVLITPPIYEVQASTLSNVLSSILSGAGTYAVIDEYMKYLNDTEEGRTVYLNTMKQQYGVSTDSYYTSLLESIMNNLSIGVSTIDPSINDKPYLYFLNPDSRFNAACGPGHVITVNQGIFNLTNNIDEVAVVLAHEMGHGQKNHAVKGMRKKIANIVGASVLANATGNSEITRAILNIVVTQINNVQITKVDEWEADNLAFNYCYHAGFNPGATAALWQRVIEKEGIYKQDFIGEIFSPNDHPSPDERRDNYEEKLTELSNGHVTIKEDSDMIQINGKDFIAPAALDSMSSAERKYLVMGKLAKAYADENNDMDIYVKEGTVMLGNHPIITPVAGDLDPADIAGILNDII